MRILSCWFKFSRPPHQVHPGVTHSRSLRQSPTIRSCNFFSRLQPVSPWSSSPVPGPSLILPSRRCHGPRSQSSHPPIPGCLYQCPLLKRRGVQLTSPSPLSAYPYYFFMYTVLPIPKTQSQNLTIFYSHYWTFQTRTLPQHIVDTCSCRPTDRPHLLSVHPSTHHQQPQTSTGSRTENRSS